MKRRRTGDEQRKEDRGHAEWRWQRPVFRATGDRNVKGQCRMWNVLSHAQIRRHVHDDTQKTLAESHCALQEQGLLGFQRLLCLNCSM